MRKLMFALFAGTIVVLAGCLKNDDNTSNCTPVTATAPASEVAAVKAYLDSNHITATQDSRGFFYIIDSSASTTTDRPTKCSYVSVSYIGKLTNGKIFDSTTSPTKPASFNLSGVITGWQEAIPLMKTNSIMKLYLPPSLGYGASDYYTIPGNSILVFEDIRLQAFAN